MLLLDVAANYGNYNADLTRTIPVNGKFTPRQRQVCHGRPISPPERERAAGTEPFRTSPCALHGCLELIPMRPAFGYEGL